MSVLNLRFSTDEDLLRYEPNLDQIWPRKTRSGDQLRNWDVQHRLAAEEIERRLRAGKSTAEPIELGRLGARTKERLRDPSACFALHYIFVAADTAGDETGYFSKKSNYYMDKATEMLEAEEIQMDYDIDNSGTIDDFEKNQPMPTRFIRG